MHPAFRKLRLPVVAAPLFIISTPQLVIAQCKAGIVGSMPALNARPASQLDEWLHEISETLAAHDRAHPDAPAAPFAINLIVHRTVERLEHDWFQIPAERQVVCGISFGYEDPVHRANGFRTTRARMEQVVHWVDA